MPVFVHGEDVKITTTRKQKRTEAGLGTLLEFRRAPARRIVAEIARNGGLRVPPVKSVETFADGDELDLPGRPRVVHTPGHTHGHCVVHLADRGVVFAGDALCTLNVLRGTRGPALMPPAMTVNTPAGAGLARPDRGPGSGHGAGRPWGAVDRGRGRGRGAGEGRGRGALAVAGAEPEGPSEAGSSRRPRCAYPLKHMSLTMGTRALRPPRREESSTSTRPTAAPCGSRTRRARVRGILGGETVVDSRRVKLLHEARHLPVWYFPREDVRMELLEPSELVTRCPYKGEASHFTVRAGDREEPDAAWNYPEPIDGAPPCAGYIAFHGAPWTRGWRRTRRSSSTRAIPDHRVDVLDRRATSASCWTAQVLADTTRARALFESGLPTAGTSPRRTSTSAASSASSTPPPARTRAPPRTVPPRVNGREEADVAWRTASRCARSRRSPATGPSTRSATASRSRSTARSTPARQVPL